MKLIVAIIKPYKSDDVREAVSELGISGNDPDRSKGLWAAERPYRTLSRRRVRDRLSAQGKTRNRGGRRHGGPGGGSHLQGGGIPARSATAKSLSAVSNRPFAFAPVRPATTHFRETSHETKHHTCKKPDHPGAHSVSRSGAGPGRRPERRQYVLDSDLYRAGAVHDAARPVAFLRRPGADQECPVGFLCNASR